MVSRLIERAFGWVFGPFNRFFKASSDRYQGSVSRILTRRGVVFAVYAVLLAGAALMFPSRPPRCRPTPDNVYLLRVAQLPESRSPDRTSTGAPRRESDTLHTRRGDRLIA